MMMARPSQVTYEQVAGVANWLFSQGVKEPGATAIRVELAKKAGPGAAVGSLNTIQRYLTEWRAKERPMEAAEVPQLPPHLAAELARQLNAAATLAREKVEERLNQVLGEMAELVAVGETNEARVDELQLETSTRTSERDSMAGLLAERTAEVTELKAALAIAGEKAAELERNLHAAQAQAQAAEGRVDEIRQATERQVAKMQADVDQARAGALDAQRQAATAEKESVGALAHRDGERAAKEALAVQVAELAASVKRLEGEAARAAAAEASTVVLREQVALQASTVELLRAMVNRNERSAAPESVAPPAPEPAVPPAPEPKAGKR